MEVFGDEFEFLGTISLVLSWKKPEYLHKTLEDTFSQTPGTLEHQIGRDKLQESLQPSANLLAKSARK